MQEGEFCTKYQLWKDEKVFRKIKHLQFSEPDLGERILFSRGEWITIHEVLFGHFIGSTVRVKHSL